MDSDFSSSHSNTYNMVPIVFVTVNSHRVTEGVYCRGIRSIRRGNGLSNETYRC